MPSILLVSFVARHAAELQGLRTVLVGALCLLVAVLQLSVEPVGPEAPIVSGVGWIAIVLIGWHLDDCLVAYYRRRVGLVLRLRRFARTAGLLLAGVTYLVLRVLETRSESPVALSALFVAAIQLHIGLISGETFRRHYLVGAACWASLALIPLWTTPATTLGTFWLVALGVSLTTLGWCDHVLLIQAMSSSEESNNATHV